MFIYEALRCDALIFNHISYIVNGKAIPFQALTGPEGSRRLRLPDIKKTGK
jgi:hypothetical protein